MKGAFTSILRVCLFSIPILINFSCSEQNDKTKAEQIVQKQKVLYTTYCASCHVAPEITDLPKNIWENNILPEMGIRMGVRDKKGRDVEGISLREQYELFQKGIFPSKAIITNEDWELLKSYIINLAPDSLISPNKNKKHTELTQFVPKPISIAKMNLALFSFLDYDDKKNKLYLGDMQGYLSTYDFGKSEITKSTKFQSPVVDYIKKGKIEYVTGIGVMNPTENASGSIFLMKNEVTTKIPEVFHRPVNTLVHDFNKDGEDELIVSEFGYYSGKLSLLQKKEGNYKKTLLSNKPGATRAIAKDMNSDNKDDLIVLLSQGDENITIYYQEENLSFRADKVIRFNPVYGSSWFELVDYDGDGDDDIITVNGDNADKSVIPKPYHGLRIHINDGSNNFKEDYFYPMNGATRFVANDFDQDGDIDFGIVANFPDYENHPEFSFVYLENTASKSFKFKPYTFDTSNLGRWFLMDAGDVDQDGDMDIILSSFSYPFSPVPKELQEKWEKEKTHLMFLENNLVK